MRFEFGGRAARILDFDCECRPIAWYGGEFVTKQPTVIAWRFVGEDEPTQVHAIGATGLSKYVLSEEQSMLFDFLAAYQQADIVTGHFIRGFDLPLLSGALIRLGYSPLPPKMAQDTKNDFVKRTGMSMSQENLGAMFDLEQKKVGMNTAKWADANMLLPQGIEAAKERALGDVEQHTEMRGIMLQRGLLSAPSLWTPKSSGSGKYHA